MAIQKADLDLRRTVLVCLIVFGAVGFIALQWGLPKVMEAIAAQEPAQAIRSLKLMAGASFYPALPLAYFTYKVARRIRTSRRFPPPGMAVIRDTKILTGDAAKQLGSKLMAVSFLFGLMTLLGIAFLPYVINQLGLE